jgi:nitric oxide reductase subunit C
MQERTLRTVFFVGTIGCFAVLGVMTAHSLGRVRAGRTAPLTEPVVAGKAVWQHRNCNDCHTILGIGGYFAPDLTTVAARRDSAWLSGFLASPAGMKPGTTMPDQRLSVAEVENVAAFFRWVKAIDTNQWPPAPRATLATGGPPHPGADLFARKACSGCHAVHAVGAAGPGPDLSRIGAVPYDALPNDPEFLARWLDDPAREKPGTTMPRIPLTPAERDTLVTYLASLQ